MNVHVIFDFMHIYYKYFFQMQSGRMPKLTSDSDIVKEVGGRTEMIYYPLKDIERIRKMCEDKNLEVTYSICLDSKSKRKDEDDAYKSGRQHVFTDVDDKNIEIISKIFEQAGGNVYKVPGYEADDLIADLCNNYRSNFDVTLIVTNDKDVLNNICDNVQAMRFKQKAGYEVVTVQNFSSYLSSEFKADIRYDNLGLFLSTVGDSSDKIKGINKFGPKAFDKMMVWLDENTNIDWSKANNYDYLENVIKNDCSKYLNEEQLSQAIESFNLVRNYKLPLSLAFPSNKCNKNKRSEAYMQLGMKSLIN